MSRERTFEIMFLINRYALGVTRNPVFVMTTRPIHRHDFRRVFAFVIDVRIAFRTVCFARVSSDDNAENNDNIVSYVVFFNRRARVI